MVNMASLLRLLRRVKVGTFTHSTGLSPHIDVMHGRRQGLYSALGMGPSTGVTGGAAEGRESPGQAARGKLAEARWAPQTGGVIRATVGQFWIKTKAKPNRVRPQR